MPPKRRAASSKKPKPSQPSQPAKFGILHFFERQTQASQNAKRQRTDAPAPAPPPAPPPPPPAEEPSEVSPEVTKTLAPNRARFSPGMSQDDGAAEVVTWKISPVNQRLGTTKSKQFLGMAPPPYSSEKNSSLEAMKKWHSSPLGLSRSTTSGRNSGVRGSALVDCDGAEDTQSPFRTPPSLSYGCNEVIGSTRSSRNCCSAYAIPRVTPPAVHTEAGTSEGQRGTRGRPRWHASTDDDLGSSRDDRDRVPLRTVGEDAPMYDDAVPHEPEDTLPHTSEGGGGSTSSAVSKPYKRGPSTLPKRPIPLDRRPLIAPEGDRNWVLVQEGGVTARNVNGILALLCKEHYPGLVYNDDDEEEEGEIPRFDHYALFPAPEPYNNLADQVVSELWDFFRCQPGQEQAASQVAYASCKKRVDELYYEARLQAHIDYNADYRKRRINKTQARAEEEILTREQYLQAIPSWCASHPDCWATIVEMWLDPEWQKEHLVKSGLRALMPGAPHHQGSASLSKYAKTYSAAHGGRPIGQLEAYALSKMGSAKSNIEYNPDAGPEAYTNSNVHPRLVAYTEAARSVYGPSYDPRTEERLDPEIVMRVGEGKKHGRFMIGHSLLDRGSTPPLNRLRATSTSSSVPIRQRPSTVTALQAEVEQLRANQAAMEAEREAERQRQEAERAAALQRQEAERDAALQRVQAVEAQQEGLLKFVQALGEQNGWQIPLHLLQASPPPQSTPHQSGAASNQVGGSPASHVETSQPGPSPGSHVGESQPGPSPGSHVGPQSL